GALGAAPLFSADPPAATNAEPPKVSAEGLFPDPVIAKGTGVEVKRSQLDQEVIRIKAQAAAAKQPIPPSQSAALERQILDQLIRLHLLMAKATDADKAAGKEQAEKQLEEARKKLGSDELFNNRLKAEGITREELMSKWAEATTAQTMLRRELKVNVAAEEAKKYYDENPARFEQPEMVRAAHILLHTRDATTGTELSQE